METPETHILDVAERLFAQGGYGATSMRDVAQGAGVNVAALYYHCGSKREIFKLIYARVVEKIAAFVSETFAAGGEFEEIAARIVDRVIELFVQHPSVPRLLERAHLGEVPSEDLKIPAYDAILARGTTEIRRLVKQRKIRPIEPRPFLTAATGVFLHLAIDATESGPPDAATVVSLQKTARMFILGALGIEKRKIVSIHFETRGRVALITIDRLERRNSLDVEHFGHLANAWLRFRDDPELWVAIVTGKADVFCVGADLKSFVPMVTDNIDALASGEQTIGGEGFPDNAPLIAVLRDFELYKPVIAAVNGLCAGGGVEMLHGVDIRVASDDARFCVAEVRRGLFPGGGTTVMLPRHIAWCHAMEMLLTGDYIDAQRAYDFGMVNRVVPKEKLMDTAFEFADKILKNGPCAVRAVKEAAVKALRMPLPEALNQELGYAASVFSTEDAMEGPRAFAEKRAPVWKGR